MEIEKNKWRELWLDSINELTTLELQKYSWLKNTDSPHWSFVEFNSCYFDDLLIYDYSFFINKKWLSNIEYKTIEKWHLDLYNYEPPKKDDYNHKAILKDEKWLKIVEIGKKSKEELIKLINKKEEKLLLGLDSYKDYKII